MTPKSKSPKKTKNTPTTKKKDSKRNRESSDKCDDNEIMEENDVKKSKSDDSKHEKVGGKKQTKKTVSKRKRGSSESDDKKMLDENVQSEENDDDTNYGKISRKKQKKKSVSKSDDNEILEENDVNKLKSDDSKHEKVGTRKQAKKKVSKRKRESSDSDDKKVLDENVQCEENDDDTNYGKVSKRKQKKKRLSKRKREASDECDDDEILEENDQYEENDVKKGESDDETNYGKGGIKKYGKFQKYNNDKLWKLDRIPHHLLPSFNVLWKETDLQEIREMPLLKISLPHSVFVNSKFHEDIDMCHRRTIALNSYMTRLRCARASYHKAKRNKRVRKDEKKGIYNKSLITFAEQAEFRPDKFFWRDYDHYYTGGNLSVNNQLSHIAHVGGPQMNTLILSVVNIINNIPKVHKLTSVDFKSDVKDEEEIFEVQFSQSNNQHIFLRQKRCVSIQNFQKGNLNTVQNFKNKAVPFISFTQDVGNANHLAITDLQHKVRLCDIETASPIQTIKMMPKDEVNARNNWNMIKSIDANVYVYAACKKVSIIDTRIPQNEYRSSYCGLKKENSCYEFCSLARSKFENLFYIGSNHKAYCLDRRYMGKDVETKHSVVATWTHQMSSYPLMMATMGYGDAEYIVLQSPLSSDMRIIENMRCYNESQFNGNKSAKKTHLDMLSTYNYDSFCLPLMPTSIESAFNEARLEGKCIKQGSGMCDRVKACITGLDFLQDSPSTFLFTATSNGDIFSRSMYDPDEFDIKSSTAADVMSQYEDNIFRSVRKAPIELTEVNDLKGISKVFRCEFFSKKMDECDLPNKRKHMGRWQKPISKLSKYKDALANDLMSIWDFEIEEDKDVNIYKFKNETFDSKVSGWLQDTTDIAHSTMINMTSIPMDMLNASNLSADINETSFAEMTNNTTYNALEEETFAVPAPVCATAHVSVPSSVVAKPKISKKKAKYVKGF